MTRLTRLSVNGSRAGWEGLGLRFAGSNTTLAGVVLEVRGDDATPGSSTTAGTFGGLESWGLATDDGAEVVPRVVDIDGIVTGIDAHGDRPAGPSPIGGHRVVAVDHVVVNTDDQARTCSAFERELGLEVRRIRDAGHGVEQRFLTLENCVIEVVSGPHVRGPGASLWGFVLSVDDLFGLADDLGAEVLSPPRRAVQPGRHIATVRASLGLGVAVAFMTPRDAGAPGR